MKQETVTIDHTDLELVHALQVHPAASWQLVGSVLGVDPVTVARRWSRLADGGWVWVSTSPTPLLAAPLCTALVEVDCAPGQVEMVAARIADDTQAITIEHIAGNADLLVVVATSDLAAMSDYVHGQLGGLDGITGIRSNVVTHLLAEGGGWKLDVLDPAQLSRLHRDQPAREPRIKPLQAPDYRLIELLHADGRSTAAELAQRLSVSPATVRRRVAALTTSGHLALRCELARSQAGWPVTAVYWGSAPACDLAEIGAQLRHRPETRTCLALAGPRNIWLVSYLHSIADSQRLEAQLAQTIPNLTINDRAITYRTVKQFGHRLDSAGRRLATVGVPTPFHTDPITPGRSA
ncbi:Lrp/AsnC family transcriptional regulator [Nocardia sp. NPDC058518]|uniref:Lrp/AsnC family transcriptional regulator n=1 Tax=Nocardia sp. NPDC058518 TaxID=3346534 RepID=UPI003652C8C3